MFLKKDEYFDYDSLLDGDILAFSDTSVIGKAIQSVTKSACQHVGYVFRENKEVYVVEAYFKVRKIKLKTLIKEYQEKFDNKGIIWHLALNKKYRDSFNNLKFLEFTIANLGKKYDWFQVANAGLDFADGIGITKNKENDSRLFCSELAYRMLEESTIIKNKNASEITPADMSQFKIYDKMKSKQLAGDPTYLYKFNYRRL